jgi:hypothetical protein
MLTLGTPQLGPLDASGVASLEKPLVITLGSPTFADGTALGQGDVQNAGAFVYRSARAGVAEEIWNERDMQWQPVPSDPSALQPLPFQWKAGRPQPWQGLLVALGQKDAGDAERYAQAVGGFPQYRARAWFVARRDGTSHSALSSPSADFSFTAESERARFGVVFDTKSAQDATRARFQLKTAGLTPAGYIELRAAGANAVEIASCDGGGAVVASILLSIDGHIRLRPSAGASVIVEGNLECEQLTYLGNSGKRVLP